MNHNQTKNKPNNPVAKNLHPAFLLALPALIIFDLVMYFTTRSSCLVCPQASEFIHNSSVTTHLLANTLQTFKRG